MQEWQTKIVAYTDGGCRGNPGVGGWGAWLRYKDWSKEMSGGEKETTNNRMELTAVIKTLENIKNSNSPVIIYTDSIYVMKGITLWIVNWKKKNWKNVKNIDLWKNLDSLAQSFPNLEWKWVKGHSGDEGNEMADKLANQAMDKIQGK